jgi:hypothetical protein
MRGCGLPVPGGGVHEGVRVWPAVNEGVWPVQLWFMVGWTSRNLF